MVKRRRLETPSTADLDRIEQEFRSETSPRPTLSHSIAPIAQVAAETASQVQTEGADVRAVRARAEADAARYHKAQEEGLLITELPTREIAESAMIRDRMIVDEAELLELRLSISSSGLRLPIEVYELEKPRADGVRYGLISGYRRLLAVRGLYDLTEAEKYTRIRAILRPRTGMDSAFVSMVEENEIRSELSHFERGRIAVISAQQGAFANTEEAVAKLFANGSKAKRSKVRSFALIFEELGDMLEHAELLTEKRGLRLAAALRLGAESRLRDALSNHSADDADQEWALMEPVIVALESAPRDKSRGGRPKSEKKPSGWADAQSIKTSTGITIRSMQDSQGFVLRFEGSAIDAELMENLLTEIQSLLEKP